MKWLVISYYARMPGACQSEWIDDRINALCELKQDVSLISSICSGSFNGIKNYRAFSFSPADLNYECKEIVSRAEDHSSLSVKASRLIAAILTPLVWLEAKVLKAHGEGRWSWIPIGLLYSLFLAFRTSFDIVFSTGGPASAHVVAILAGKILGKKVMCELQDPLVGADIGRNAFSRLGLSWAECFIFKYADHVVFCTQNAARDASSRSRYFRRKISYIYPGSLRRQLVAKSSYSNMLTFCYLGSLYQTRNLDMIMEAFLRLSAKGINLEKRLRLNVFGNMNPDIRSRIEKFPIPIIKLNTLVPREDALSIAQKSDVLLLIQNTDNRSQLTIPFKTYDYLQSGSLILGLIYKNEELSQMLVQNGHLACKADNIDEIQQAIEHILAAQRKEIRIPQLTPVEAARSMITLAEKPSKLTRSVSVVRRQLK